MSEVFLSSFHPVPSRCSLTEVPVFSFPAQHGRADFASRRTQHLICCHLATDWDTTARQNRTVNRTNERSPKCTEPDRRRIPALQEFPCVRSLIKRIIPQNYQFKFNEKNTKRFPLRGENWLTVMRVSSAIGGTSNTIGHPSAIVTACGGDPNVCEGLTLDDGPELDRRRARFSGSVFDRKSVWRRGAAARTKNKNGRLPWLRDSIPRLELIIKKTKNLLLKNND